MRLFDAVLLRDDAGQLDDELVVEHRLQRDPDVLLCAGRVSDQPQRARHLGVGGGVLGIGRQRVGQHVDRAGEVTGAAERGCSFDDAFGTTGEESHRRILEVSLRARIPPAICHRAGP